MAENTLITGARAPVALEMARCFKRAGYNVYLADCSSAYMAKWSSAAQKVLAYASPVHQPEQFRRDIGCLIDRLQPKLVVPTCEEVFHLSHPLLEERLKGILFAPSLSVLDQLHNKAVFNQLCAELNIPAPETHFINRYEELQRYQASSKEWVFKSCYSRFGAQTLIQPPFEKLLTIQPSTKSRWIAQKFIPGIECSFYAVSHHGKLTAFVAYQSNWRLKGGASYAFTRVGPDAEKQARYVAKLLAEKLSLTGQFSCDLIIDSTGQAWPIECNPRATSGLHLLTEQDCLAQAIIENKTCNVISSTPDKYMLSMMMSYGFVKAIRERKYKNWFSTLISGGDVISARNDHLPLLGSVIDTLIFLKQASKHNISLSQATTRDIEWNGEAHP